jgi:Leucine-rich repeat (LRR) protein
MFVGSISRNIGFLSNLWYLYIDGNNLTGAIPLALRNITHLVDITLHSNQLDGSIPKELGQSPDIRWMSLWGNRLSGRVPATLFNLSHLVELDLSMNWLSGHSPNSVANASNLLELDLSSKYLTGPIPSGLYKLHQLQYLHLEKNKLSSISNNIVQSIASSRPILSMNRLSVHIPDSLGNGSEMNEIDLSSNYFTGPIPSGLGKLHQLQYLHLEKISYRVEFQQHCSIYPILESYT